MNGTLGQVSGHSSLIHLELVSFHGSAWCYDNGACLIGAFIHGIGVSSCASGRRRYVDEAAGLCWLTSTFFFVFAFGIVFSHSVYSSSLPSRWLQFAIGSISFQLRGWNLMVRPLIMFV